MKLLRWSEVKNRALVKSRGISFETAAFLIGQGRVLDLIEHPNPTRYRGQKMYVLEINRYAYLVPFVESDREIFLKTIIPSRRATRRYLRKRRGGNGETES